MEDKIIIALIAGISAAICGGVSSYAVGLLLWKRTRQPSFWRVPIANAAGDGDVKKNPHRGYTINVDQVLYVSGGVQTLKEGAQVEPTKIHFANGEKLEVEGGDNPLFQGLVCRKSAAESDFRIGSGSTFGSCDLPPPVCGEVPCRSLAEFRHGRRVGPFQQAGLWPV